MPRLLRAVVVAVSLALVAPLAGPANAAGGGTIVGTGTVSPGITEVCTAQTIGFSGTAVAADTGDAGVYSFNFSGASSGCETVLSGAGAGTVSGGMSGSLSYSRTGPVLTAQGDVTINGHGRHILVICWLIITSWPVRTFIKGCIWI